MDAQVRVGCILMASGAGVRFGSNKLLAAVDGTPLFRRALEVLPASLFTRAVAITQYTPIRTAATAAGYLVLPNPTAAEGISSSIRQGLAAVSDLDGAFFSVCDQPWLKTASVQRLLSAFAVHPNAIVALSWEGKRGNPVIFPRALFPDLLALTGDTGGGVVVNAHPERLLLVEVSDPRELCDVDTTGDL